MIIQSSNQIMRPIVSPPQHNFDSFKTPTQKQLEHKANMSNGSVKKVVEHSINEIYRSLQKMVENTDYNVSYKLDESTGGQQFRITMKNSGNLVAAFPPEAAIQIADRAKNTTVGVLMDMIA